MESTGTDCKIGSCQLFPLYDEGIATRGDENEQNRSQVNTKLFRSSLELPHENEDTPVAQSNEKNTMLLFCY